MNGDLPARSDTAGARFGVALAVFVVSGLWAEGLLSLLLGRSLAELWRTSAADVASVALPDREWRASRDADRVRAAASNPGFYRVHDDPLVGFVLKAEASEAVHGVPFSTDDLGMRRRPGPEPPADAVRLVVLGDSVAFGWGVADDATLAHQLELQLNAVRPEGLPPVVARTVAVPGWNHRNALHFLLDHYDRYRPDVVVYIPINNDLSDTYGVYESGHRRLHEYAQRPGSSTPWLLVHTDRVVSTSLQLVQRLRRGAGVPADAFPARLGSFALDGDLSPMSSRRFDANATSVEQLARFLAQHDASLLVPVWGAEPYFSHLMARVLERRPGLASVPLLRSIPREFQLEGDPHPNPDTLGVVATWVAEALLAEGLLPGGGDASGLPSVPAAYAALRAEAHDLASWRREVAVARAGRLGQLVPVVEPDQARGLYQVYGGLLGDGSMGRHLLALMPRAGDELLVELEPLVDRPELLPLEVTVLADGVELGRLTLTGDGGDGVVSERFRLPAGDGPVEIGLHTGRHVAVEVDGRTRLASCRLRRLACDG